MPANTITAVLNFQGAVVKVFTTAIIPQDVLFVNISKSVRKPCRHKACKAFKFFFSVNKVYPFGKSEAESISPPPVIYF